MDPRIVTLCHTELSQLRAHVFLHGQRTGTYGIFFEYPHPLPGVPECEENLPLHKLIDSLALHFETQKNAIIALDHIFSWKKGCGGQISQEM